MEHGGPTKVTAQTITDTPPPDRLTRPPIEASVVLVFVVDLKVVASMDQDLERVGVISGGSIHPFVWNVLMAARQAGFGGTITTLAVAQEAKIQELLTIPADHVVCTVVPLGKPVKQLTKLKRKTVEQIATCERFDGTPFSRRLNHQPLNFGLAPQLLQHGIRNLIGKAFQFLRRAVLDGVRNVHHRRFESKGLRLRDCGGLKGFGGNYGTGESAPVQLKDVVQTARRAGASIR